MVHNYSKYVIQKSIAKAGVPERPPSVQPAYLGSRKKTMKPIHVNLLYSPKV